MKGTESKNAWLWGGIILAMIVVALVSGWLSSRSASLQSQSEQMRSELYLNELGQMDDALLAGDFGSIVAAYAERLRLRPMALQAGLGGGRLGQGYDFDTEAMLARYWISAGLWPSQDIAFNYQPSEQTRGFENAMRAGLYDALRITSSTVPLNTANILKIAGPIFALDDESLADLYARCLNYDLAKDNVPAAARIAALMDEWPQERKDLIPAGQKMTNLMAQGRYTEAIALTGAMPAPRPPYSEETRWLVYQRIAALYRSDRTSEAACLADAVLTSGILTDKAKVDEMKEMLKRVRGP